MIGWKVTPECAAYWYINSSRVTICNQVITLEKFDPFQEYKRMGELIINNTENRIWTLLVDSIWDSLCSLKCYCHWEINKPISSSSEKHWLSSKAWEPNLTEGQLWIWNCDESNRKPLWTVLKIVKFIDIKDGEPWSFVLGHGTEE